MKIELTMTELLLIVDMIKNGTEQDNEGTDTYTVKELYDAFINGADTKLRCTVCGSDGMRFCFQLQKALTLTAKKK
jgi:hypothetical protein